MEKFELKSAASAEPNRFGPTTPELSEEDKSMDEFFVQLARITEAMGAKHGKEFAMGTLILSARFLAEGKALIKRDDDAVTSVKSTNDPTHTHSKNCGCS